MFINTWKQVMHLHFCIVNNHLKLWKFCTFSRLTDPYQFHSWEIYCYSNLNWKTSFWLLVDTRNSRQKILRSSMFQLIRPLFKVGFLERELNPSFCFFLHWNSKNFRALMKNTLTQPLFWTSLTNLLLNYTKYFKGMSK